MFVTVALEGLSMVFVAVVYIVQSRKAKSVGLSRMQKAYVMLDFTVILDTLEGSEYSDMHPDDAEVSIFIFFHKGMFSYILHTLSF